MSDQVRYRIACKAHIFFLADTCHFYFLYCMITKEHNEGKAEKVFFVM
jgi:hypothetical protein